MQAYRGGNYDQKDAVNISASQQSAINKAQAEVDRLTEEQTQNAQLSEDIGIKQQMDVATIVGRMSSKDLSEAEDLISQTGKNDTYQQYQAQAPRLGLTGGDGTKYAALMTLNAIGSDVNVDPSTRSDAIQAIAGAAGYRTSASGKSVTGDVSGTLGNLEERVRNTRKKVVAQMAETTRSANQGEAQVAKVMKENENTGKELEETNIGGNGGLGKMQSAAKKINEQHGETSKNVGGVVLLGGEAVVAGATSEIAGHKDTLARYNNPEYSTKRALAERIEQEATKPQMTQGKVARVKQSEHYQNFVDKNGAEVKAELDRKLEDSIVSGSAQEAHDYITDHPGGGFLANELRKARDGDVLDEQGVQNIIESEEYRAAADADPQWAAGFEQQLYDSTGQSLSNNEAFINASEQGSIQAVVAESIYNQAFADAKGGSLTDDQAHIYALEVTSNLTYGQASGYQEDVALFREIYGDDITTAVLNAAQLGSDHALSTVAEINSFGSIGQGQEISDGNRQEGFVSTFADKGNFEQDDIPTRGPTPNDLFAEQYNNY